MSFPLMEMVASLSVRLLKVVTKPDDRTVPPAFTVSFESDVQSEWDAAAETARCFGAEHHAVSLDDEALAALLLRPDVLEERYREIQARKVEYLGIAYHAGGGTKESDRLCRTFELMFDAQFVRANNKPIDLFKIKAKDKDNPLHQARLAAYGALVVTRQHAGLYSMPCAAVALA